MRRRAGDFVSRKEGPGKCEPHGALRKGEKDD